ncbi:1-acyl-sn-glycerol-3-phosphate acyltransferase [filamentous cyanobacterium CCP5]|nr:1-acyl-sn-glycerol-3-phosphate acyltransferase [filamentous cyanobacterium CCP5]
MSLSVQNMSHIHRSETALAKPTSVQSECSPLLTPIAYFLGCRIVMPLYFGRIRIRGQENLPQSGPVILAPTHRSRWDSLLIPMVTGRTVTGRDLHFMVTADEVKGLQGWFILRLGGFPVNVHRPSVASLRHGIDLLVQQSMLVIYPEGGIYRDHIIHRLKPGLARLALQAESTSPNLGIQIVPITLDYSDPYVGWGSDVQVTIGQPLLASRYVEDDDGESLKANAKDLTQALQTALESLDSARDGQD